LAIAAAGVVVALLRPGLVGAAGLVALALVPVYSAPKVGPIDAHPAVLAFWLCAFGAGVTLIARRERIGVSAIDMAVGLFLLSTLFSVYDGGPTRTDWISFTFPWLGSYLGMRLLLAHERRPDWLPRMFVFSALLVVPFALYEWLTGDNVFFRFVVNGAAGELWATSQDRLGTARVEASFGHAIALGMFVASAFVFSIALAAHEQRRRVRWAWLVCGLVLLAVLAITVSRTGWVTAGVGVVLLALGPADRRGRRWLTGFIAVAIACTALLAVAVPRESVGPTQLLSGSGTSTELQNSDNWRLALLERAVTSDRLGLFGNRGVDLTTGLSAGDHSIDNAYLAIANDWGVSGMAMLALVALTLALAVWQSRLAGICGSVAVVAFANFTALLFVAFITQQAFYIWALAGAAAAIAARLRVQSR